MIIIVILISITIIIIRKGMVENSKKVSDRATVAEIQKICLLGTVRNLRKVLSV